MFRIRAISAALGLSVALLMGGATTASATPTAVPQAGSVSHSLVQPASHNLHHSHHHHNRRHHHNRHHHNRHHRNRHHHNRHYRHHYLTQYHFYLPFGRW